MPRSKRTPSVLDAIHQALAILARLPDWEEVRALRQQCEDIEKTAKEWAHRPPSPEEKDAMMKRVLALHILVTKARRKSTRPPKKKEDE